MREPGVQLERVPTGKHLSVLARTLAVVVAVGLLTFVAGFGLGSQSARSPLATEGSSPPASVPPAVVGGGISHELWTAYLNRGGDGWGLCKVSVEISCQPITAVPGPFFTSADPFPSRVTDTDWGRFAPVTVGPGHYVLAGPVTGIAPQAVFEGVGDGGYPTYEGATEVVWNGVLWVDVGSLGRGRYAMGVWDYVIGSPDGRGGAAVQLAGWGMGMTVTGT